MCQRYEALPQRRVPGKVNLSDILLKFPPLIGLFTYCAFKKVKSRMSQAIDGRHRCATMCVTVSQPVRSCSFPSVNGNSSVRNWRQNETFSESMLSHVLWRPLTGKPIRSNQSVSPRVNFQHPLLESTNTPFERIDIPTVNVNFQHPSQDCVSQFLKVLTFLQNYKSIKTINICLHLKQNQDTLYWCIIWIWIWSTCLFGNAIGMLSSPRSPLSVPPKTAEKKLHEHEMMLREQETCWSDDLLREAVPNQNRYFFGKIENDGRWPFP